MAVGLVARPVLQEMVVRKLAGRVTYQVFKGVSTKFGVQFEIFAMSGWKEERMTA